MLHEQSGSRTGKERKGDQKDHDPSGGLTAAKRYKVTMGKICSACGQEKTITLFVKRDGKIYGPYLKCAACKKRRDAEGFQKHKQKRKRAQEKYKTENAESIRQWCRDYRAKHLAAFREYHRAYFQNHKEKWNAYNAAFKERNPEKVRAYKTKWRLANPEKVRALSKAWWKAHPDKQRDKNLRHRARKKTQKVGDWTLVVKWQQVWRKKPKARCYWCGKTFPSKQCHSDHIVALAKGGIHEISNLCISCACCNQKKSDRSVETWNQLIEQPVLL